MELLAIAAVVVLFGTSTFLRKLAVDDMSPYRLQLISSCVYAALTPIWCFLTPKVGTPPPISATLFGIFAILTNVTGAVLFGFLLKGVHSTTHLASAASSSPVVTAALAAMFLGEPITIRKAVGVVLVLLGMIVFNG